MMETVALAASVHVRGTRRHHRALTDLRARFPESVVVAAETIKDLPDRLVFLTEGSVIDESVFRAINECDEASVPVAMLAYSGQLISRERLSFSFFERSTHRFFARVEAHRDSRIKLGAWG